MEDGEAGGAVHLSRPRTDNAAPGRGAAARRPRRPPRAGIGAPLLDAVNEHARELGLRLLWLTTHADTDSDAFYVRRRWTRIGDIPDYSRRPDGTLARNAFFYLQLG